MSVSYHFKAAAAVLVSLSFGLLGTLPAHSQADESQTQSSIAGSYDFSWRAQNTDGMIALSGSVPSESLQRFLLIRAGEGGVENLVIGRGAPETFISSSIAGLDALKKLNSGNFQFADGIWTIGGLAQSSEEKDNILAVLTRAVDTGDWVIEIEVAPAPIPVQEDAIQVAASDMPEEPVISEDETGTDEIAKEKQPAIPEAAEPVEPVELADNSAYRFDALRTDGTLTTLSGNLPAQAFANYVSQIAGDASTDSIEIMSDAPKNFRINVITGLKALEQLRSGLLSFQNGQWTLVGDALDEQIGNSARQSVLTWEGGEDWVLDIVTVPAMEICKLSIARFTESKTILFAPASAQLTAESVRNIVELAVSLNRCEQSPIYVSGHTDSDGPAEDNMALSVARAEAVVVALIEAGVDDSRLYAVGYGETLPVATNDTRAGKALNRRIVFELGDE